jgi:hypothetical protein
MYNIWIVLIQENKSTEPATFSILSLWSFFRDSLFLSILSLTQHYIRPTFERTQTQFMYNIWWILEREQITRSLQRTTLTISYNYTDFFEWILLVTRCRSTFVSEHICLTKCDRCVRKHSYLRQIGNEIDVSDTQKKGHSKHICLTFFHKILKR